MDREAWLQERRTGLGGSDAASVFGIGWGCKKRLFLDKRGVPPDYPFEETDAMSLGSYLEAWFAKKYQEKTGRVVEVATSSFVHPVFPELRVNADRIIYKPEAPTDKGVLEIKSQGRDVFYRSRREGIADDYLLQLSWGMTVVGTTWGSFAIGSRDSGDLLHFDLALDPLIRDAILEEGPKFWATVENGPMPDALEPDDRRCQECGYRLTCHGNALVNIEKASEYERDESLAPLVAEFVERRAAKKEAEDLLNETKEEIMARLGSRGMVTAAGARLQYYSFEKAEYTVPAHRERPLRIYPRKARR